MFPVLLAEEDCAPIPISAAIQSPTIVPSYRDKVDRNSRNPSERPRTLSIVKINHGPTAPKIGPQQGNTFVTANKM